MMDKILSRDIARYIDKPKEELIEVLTRALDELKELDAIQIENGRANVAMAKDYKILENRCKDMENEIERLTKALEKSIEDNKLKTLQTFGRKTEKLSQITDTHSLQEIMDEDTVDDSNNEPSNKVIPIDKSRNKSSKKTDLKKKRIKGKREQDLSNIPSVNVYELNVEELDKKYGEHNWRIAFWRSRCQVECIPTTFYKKVSHTPVISVGLEHTLTSIPQENILIKNSIASASLVALILYQKFFLALPLYRQENDFKNKGLKIPRQTMNNWVNHLAIEVFSLVYDKMTELLMKIKYHQCDETYFRVNKDGRAAGSKSFMWVHISSELLREHPLIIYCFELTRGTDHLRKFYEDFKGFITCDAYISYHVLGKENMDVIIICGCMMHLRRRFVKSLSLKDIGNLDAHEVEELPETKVLKLIGKIYDEDEPLKELSPQKRKEMRDQKVRPLIDELYEYIDNFNTSDPLLSDKLKDAIGYAKNQKDYITRFLDDGNIPIDDGATERVIRSFAIGRNNWVACDSIEGAEAAAIMYSIVETAKANRANVYLYLRYLLEEVPKHLDGKNLDFLDDMLPWSEKYLAYENDQRISMPNLPMKENQFKIKPKTPLKTEMQLQKVIENATA